MCEAIGIGHLTLPVYTWMDSLFFHQTCSTRSRQPEGAIEAQPDVRCLRDIEADAVVGERVGCHWRPGGKVRRNLNHIAGAWFTQELQFERSVRPERDRDQPRRGGL